MSLRPFLGVLVSFLFFACGMPAADVDASEPEATNVDAQKEEKRENVLAGFERPGTVFDSTPPEGSGQGTLLFLPSVLHSGFDGVHTFQVPVSLHGAGPDLVLTADDPSSATIDAVALVDASGDNGAYFMIRPKKAGRITLTATSRGQTATAEIDVTTYAPARWAAGAARYLRGTNGAPACVQCHGGGEGIDHSPAAIASITDREVERIVTAGERGGSVPIGEVPCPTCTPEGKLHQWSVSDEERQGLVTYLRGLEPRGFR